MPSVEPNGQPASAPDARERDPAGQWNGSLGGPPPADALEAAVARALYGLLPGGKIRHAYQPVHPGRNLFMRSGPPRLRQLFQGGAALDAAGHPFPYRGDVADVLADVAAWSYSDGQTLVDELYHRGIVGAEDGCFEVSLRNDAMLVVATAFFVQSGPVGVLSFRGTEPASAINWLTDASVEPKPFLGLGRAHGGFCRNVRALWNDLDAQVSGAIADEGPAKLQALYLTGHSLGAAMAVVAAATVFADERYAAWRPLVRGVYTYGQPMAGDPDFAQSCDERFGAMHFRHVYGRDLVARLPPRTTGRFAHSGSEYVGSPDGWARRQRAVAQALTLAAIPIGIAAWAFSQFPLLRGLKLPFSLGDHSPNGYLEAFRAMRS